MYEITRKDFLNSICMSCYIDNNLKTIVSDLDGCGESILSTTDIFKYYQVRNHRVPGTSVRRKVGSNERIPDKVNLSDCNLIYKHK